MSVFCVCIDFAWLLIRNWVFIPFFLLYLLGKCAFFPQIIMEHVLWFWNRRRWSGGRCFCISYGLAIFLSPVFADTNTFYWLLLGKRRAVDIALTNTWYEWRFTSAIPTKHSHVRSNIWIFAVYDFYFIFLLPASYPELCLIHRILNSNALPLHITNEIRISSVLAFFQRKWMFKLCSVVEDGRHNNKYASLIATHWTSVNKLAGGE